MKGLILKDLMNLRQQWGAYLIIVTLWGMISLKDGSLSVFSGCIGMLMVMLPATALAYDERSGWNAYALTMPVTRRDIVLSKYILALAAMAAAMILNLVFSAVVRENFFENVLGMFCTMCVMTIWLSILMPVRFKFDAEKARVISIVMVLIPVVIIVTAGISIDRAAGGVDMINEFPAIFAFAVFAAAAVAALAVSMWISVKIVNNKDF